VPKARVLFFRVFPQFKRIIGVSKCIGFERNLAQVFDTHQQAKVYEAFTKFQNIFPVMFRRVATIENISIVYLYNRFSREPMKVTKKPHTLC